MRVPQWRPSCASWGKEREIGFLLSKLRQKLYRHVRPVEALPLYSTYELIHALRAPLGKDNLTRWDGTYLTQIAMHLLFAAKWSPALQEYREWRELSELLNGLQRELVTTDGSINQEKPIPGNSAASVWGRNRRRVSGKLQQMIDKMDNNPTLDERAWRHIMTAIQEDGSRLQSYENIELGVTEMCGYWLAQGFDIEYLRRFFSRHVIYHDEHGDTPYLQRCELLFERIQKDDDYVVCIPTHNSGVPTTEKIELFKGLPDKYKGWPDYDEKKSLFKQHSGIDIETTPVACIWVRGGRDYISATKWAVEALKTFYALNVHRGVNSGIPEYALVFNEDAPATYYSAIESVDTRLTSNVPNLDLLNSIDPIQLPTKRNYTTLPYLKRAIHFYDQASHTSLALEFRYIALWTTAEILFDSVDNIFRFLPKYVASAYVYKRLSQLHIYLPQGEISKMFGRRRGGKGKGLSNKGAPHLIGLLLSCHSVTKHQGSILYDALEEPVLEKMIHDLGQLLPEGYYNATGITSKGYEKLTQVETEARHEARHLGRIRNNIIHSGHTEPELERAFQRLDFFLSVALNQIIFIFKRSPTYKLKDINQALEDAYESLKMDAKEGKLVSKAILNPYAYYSTKGS